MARRNFPRRLLRSFRLPSKLTSEISHGSSLRLRVFHSRKPKFHYKRNVWRAFWSFWLPRAPQECPRSIAETSTGVAPERPKSVRDFSCPQKIPNGSSKLASSASSCFFAFRGLPRVGYRMARRFAWVFAAPKKPQIHYKRSVWRAFWSFWLPRAPQECPRSALLLI